MDRTLSSARYLSLSQACFINPKKSELRLPSKDLPVSFVPMAAVDEQFGCIVDSEARPLGEVQKGFTYFREGDVLLAKITPCMENGKAAIARGLVNGIGFGSTEFHVLRPKEGVLPEWVYYFVRSSTFRAEAATRMTGSAGQQRVPVSFLEEKTIPIPSVEEQHRIIRLLQQADSARRTRAKTDERTNQLTQAIFLEMFGDPAVNPRGWPITTLGDLGETGQYGLNAAALPQGATGVRFIRITDIDKFGRLGRAEPAYVSADTPNVEDYELKEGDIVIARSGATAGKSYLHKSLPFQAVFASYLIRFAINPAKALPIFVAAFLQTREYWRQRPMHLTPVSPIGSICGYGGLPADAHGV